jgi:hypothetical protein
MRDYGWSVIWRLKQHRRFNGQALRAYRRHPYWTASGWLTGGVQVVVGRDGAKDDATTRLTLPAAAVRRWHGGRAQREVVSRVGQDQLGLTGCQARSERAQMPPMAGCLVAFCVLEREHHDRQLRI